MEEVITLDAELQSLRKEITDITLRNQNGGGNNVQRDKDVSDINPKTGQVWKR